ncbi:MAG: hypothetical protein CL908_14915 [Deltaproteobacteria bacterium]|jgi:hypothetical protein|nr:hypothetical protein [Deltaproteobacteria bacterium]
MANENNRSEWAAAFQRATWGCAPAIGRALGLSPRTVQQWGQSDCKKRSPGERLEITMRIALDHRKPHDALAPLHLLASRLGYRLEPHGDHDGSTPRSRSIALHASEAMIEASQAVNAALAAQEDGLISSEELDEVHRECDEAIEALSGLKRIVSAQR